MANMMQMMKQAASMRKQMNKVQKELARQTVEAVSGPVTVVARGDMSLKSVSLDAEALVPDRKPQIEKAVAAAVNQALKQAKNQAGAEMAKMSGGLGGLGDMLGG